MIFSMLPPADRLVMIMSRLYQYGMTTTSGGNISIRDEDGSVWITPGGIDKGNLHASDIVHVLADGTVEGHHKPSSEYPFHLAIYKNRPDISAVLHAHPPALVALSAVRLIPDTTLIPDAHFICGDIAMAKYALPGSELLGQNIANKFELGHDCVMLENHGVVVGADDLFSAFTKFETLVNCAKLQINAMRLSGKIKQISEKHMALYRLKTSVILEDYQPEGFSSDELAVRQGMCNLINRGYDNGLFTSTQGTFSTRLADGSIIVTPYAMDRKYLEPEDLVKVKDNKKEKGKSPSRSVVLHNEIYKNNPGINSIIMAHPPCIMAFAVTDREFSTHTIPESYLMLRDVKRFPFGSSFMQPKLVANEISAASPVCMIENDCVITTGNSQLQAFDRLEVMEYSAKSIIEAAAMGVDVVTIEGQDIEDIVTAFNLPKQY